MSSSALGLVLSAALLHAVWNIMAKRAAARDAADSFVFVWCYTAGAAVLWLPVGLAQLAGQGWPWSWAVLIAPLGSALLHIAYSLVLQTGYRRGDLGIVYPVARGVGPALTMLIALAFLGERPQLVVIGGGLLVLAGIAVVMGGTRRSGGAALSAGLGWGVATGATIAAYTLWDSQSVTTFGVPPVTYYALTVALQTVVMAPGAYRRRAQLRTTLSGTWRDAVGVAALSPAAYTLVLIALQTTPVSVVAPVRESSIIIGAILAWRLFGEGDPLRRTIGAGVVLVGIALIASL